MSGDISKLVDLLSTSYEYILLRSAFPIISFLFHLSAPSNFNEYPQIENQTNDTEFKYIKALWFRNVPVKGMGGGPTPGQKDKIRGKRGGLWRSAIHRGGYDAGNVV